MSDTLTLDQLVAVVPRFTRSVSLLRDVHRSDALEGYLLTPTGRAVLRRLSDALHGDSATRAWSLTGPYGSGKSSFALFAAQLLAGRHEIRERARRSLAAWDAELSERLFGSTGSLTKKEGRLLPVLVSGSRRPLEQALAESLATSLRALGKGRPPQLVKRLEQFAAQESFSGKSIVPLFEEANAYVTKYGPAAAGILLIVDELGKFLEYGATNPERGDVFVLQELAEAAARSQRPFLFVTILHQALDRYAEHLSANRRAEWAKVQGRFEDVAFEERSEQTMRLLAHAIRQTGAEADLHALRKQAKTAAREAVALGLRCGSLSAAEIQESLVACYPLHPLTAFILGPLFRQFAQNERSLFAFLGSSEPFGFQEFLRENSCKDGAYRLDHLYDYIMASLGPNLFAHSRGKLWAEVQSALDRLNDVGPLEIRLVKTIGLLQALGAAAALPASALTLQMALKGLAPAEDIETALHALCQRSLVVFRRHTGSYALWEGSDVDFDDRFQAARQSVERDQSLAAFLVRQMPPQPLIARRHYFQTGTLRYFETCYAERHDFQADLFRDLLSAEANDADGRVFYCLPRDADDREAMRGFIQSTSAAIPVLVALPQDIFDLRELCHELLCLRWIAEHTPELATDRTARRELNARLALAEQNLRAHLEGLFTPGQAAACTWYYRGKAVALYSQREWNDLLSQSCDAFYPATPHWRNELINRRSLSSSAAAARRNLIEAMFEHTDEEALGFTGNPPERSMYETLLKVSRLHRKKGGVFGIHPPDAASEPAVRELWKAMEGFLAQTEESRQSVQRLFELLRRPPFGLKAGVLPVLLAALLVHGHSQIALYEEGSFVPRPNAAVFERIFRSPQKFELQRFRIAGPRAEVFEQYAVLLNRADESEPDLLGIVRPLVRVVRELPDYVGKTRQISDTAQSILRAVKEARQPDRLLFIDLPTACGYAAFAASGTITAAQLEGYFAALRAGFSELQRAYPQLLAEIERLLYNAFGREGPLTKARKEIEHDARYVLNVSVDPKLKAFLMRVADAGVEDTTWLESIATLLAGKPPTHWDDQDRARFEVQLAASARSFEHFRVLAFEMERRGYALLDGDKQLLRISITVPDGGEVERVVKVPPTLAAQARQMQDKVRKLLREGNLLDQRETSIAILGQIVRELLAESE